MNELCVHAVQLLAQVIGGMEINIWAQQFYCKPIDGLWTVEMRIEKRD